MMQASTCTHKYINNNTSINFIYLIVREIKNIMICRKLSVYGLFFITASIFLLLSVTYVCANENINLTDDEEVISDLDNLNNDFKNLSSGDVYNIDKDYYFKDKAIGFTYYNDGIKIAADNITINGNGHTIDGNYKSAFFKVTGNNVKIFNLTFINGYTTGIQMPKIELTPEKTISFDPFVERTIDVSPVCWLGDNGLISDCVFSGNSAVNGGAITWMGNNGIINNTYFNNNTAKGIGGGLYIGGTNNTLSNCTFVNCTSQLSGEAIYIDRKYKNFTGNVTFSNQSVLFIDGSLTNIDVDKYLHYSYKSQMADEYVNLVPLIYTALTVGGINYLDNGISYYAEYSNITNEFMLSLTKNFNSISYTKNYKFKNIKHYNRIFEDLLFLNDYDNSWVLVKNVYITSQDTAYAEYNNAIQQTHSIESFMPFINKYDLGDMDENIITGKIAGSAYPVTLALNITFKEKCNIYCLESLTLKNTGFDVININGHGSRIYGSGESSDEFYWVCVDENKIFSAHDLIIEAYNQAVVNMGGACIFDNIHFYKNKVDYYIKKDYGGAILSSGSVICTNCWFTYNYAKHGGAIFNQGFLSLENCTFEDNQAYGEGDNVCNGKGGSVYVDKNLIQSDTSLVRINLGLTDKEIKIISLVCVGAAIIIGIVVGVLTWGAGVPAYVAGIAGFIGASIIGAAGAVTICSNSFDINHDRLKTSLILILGCGAVGAFVGVATNILLGAMYPASIFTPIIETPTEAEAFTWNVISNGEDMDLIGGIIENSIEEVPEEFPALGEDIDLIGGIIEK